MRAALKADQTMHQAAYNLGILLTDDKPKQSIKLLQKAFETTPTPRYGYTLAFYMQKRGDLDNACKMLLDVIKQWPVFADAYLLLGKIYEGQDKTDEARALYLKAIDSVGLSLRDKQRVKVEFDKL